MRPQLPEYYSGRSDQDMTTVNALTTCIDSLRQVAGKLPGKRSKRGPRKNLGQDGRRLPSPRYQIRSRAGDRLIPGLESSTQCHRDILNAPPKPGEHGRLKSARVGLKSVRAQLAIWRSRRGFSWPPPPPDVMRGVPETPAYLFLKRSKAYLRFLDWDVRSIEEQEHILKLKDSRQHPINGGCFEVTEVPPLDELYFTHPGLKEMVQLDPAHTLLCGDQLERYPNPLR